MSRKNDRALRIYSEVFGLERLHYGFWLPEDELTIECLKTAQIRYEAYLLDNIPESVKTVLDVGCGTGIMTQKLLEQNYYAEGLSPDINQKNAFTARLKAPFHHTSFENFSPPHPFDCLIMSESAQYIDLDKLFIIARNALSDKGYLMVCDYFVLNEAAGIIKKSGHNLNAFKKQAKDQGFVLIAENDITENVVKTLDIATLMIEKLKLALDIGTEKIRQKHPHLTRLILWLNRKKIAQYTHEMALLDAGLFKKNKCYHFMLLQREA